MVSVLREALENIDRPHNNNSNPVQVILLVPLEYTNVLLGTPLLLLLLLKVATTTEAKKTTEAKNCLSMHIFENKLATAFNICLYHCEIYTVYLFIYLYYVLIDDTSLRV